ncbi:MAG: DUF4239 domain-containing protein [Stackebrandtia sp.]
MNPLLLGLIVVCGAAFLVGGIVILQQRVSEPQAREGYNEVAGSVFEIVSVLYAIVLAFVLIALWEARIEARDITYTEAEALAEVYWTTENLENEDAKAVQELSRDYVDLAVEEEWPTMADHEEVGVAGWEIIDDMRAKLAHMPLESEAEVALWEDAQEQVRTLSEARNDRLNTAQRGMTAVMWLVLIAGALLMLGVLLLFGVPGRLAHLVVVVIAASMIALLLFSVYELEFPFAREVAIGPDAYLLALERMDNIG